MPPTLSLSCPHTQESDFEPPLAFSEIPCGGDQCMAALSCPLFCLVHTGLRSSIRKRYTCSTCNRCDDMSQRGAVHSSDEPLDACLCLYQVPDAGYMSVYTHTSGTRHRMYVYMQTYISRHGTSHWIHTHTSGARYRMRKSSGGYIYIPSKTQLRTSEITRGSGTDNL